jgi:hypothetical protein
MGSTARIACGSGALDKLGEVLVVPAVSSRAGRPMARLEGRIVRQKIVPNGRQIRLSVEGPVVGSMVLKCAAPARPAGVWHQLW